MNIWDLIVESNAFNFIVLVIILSVLIKKMKVSLLLENLRQTISMKIEMSKAEREKSVEKLRFAEDKSKNLAAELNELTNLSMQNTENAVNQTKLNADNAVKMILDNVDNVINNEEKQISSKILLNAIGNSKTRAKEKIIAKLQQTPDLHNKYIDEAIADIDKVNLND